MSLLRENKISLVILDADIASGSTFEMISMIQDIRSTSRILVYSGMDKSHALKCLIAGVDGLISSAGCFIMCSKIDILVLKADLRETTLRISYCHN